MYELILLLTIVINIAADFIDRYSSNKSDAYVLTLWMSLVQFLLIFPLIGLVERISLSKLLLIAAVGAFTSFGRVRWFRALADEGEQLSRLSPLTRISSVIVLVVATSLPFFDERLSLNRALGAALIIAGAFLISVERWAPNFRTFLSNNRALWLVVVFAASNASLTILYKYLLLSHVSTWTIYIYVKLFQAIPLLWFGLDRNVLVTSYLKIRNLKVFVFARVLQTGAAFLYLIVVKHLPLTIVEPVAALSPLILLISEWFIDRSRILPRDEGVDVPSRSAKKSKPALRFAAVLAMIFGVVILGRT